tara:strand:+ start:73 stop:825 length:753 start_codon:yes stop_codon:yes gene_type:complete
MAKQKTQQFVAKSYKLTRDVAPLSFMLPTKHTKRFTLLHFDDETGTNRELRYARNQKSVYVDEQDTNALMEPIIFEDGFLHVVKENQILQKFLHLHPLNGKKFVEMDKAKDAAAEVEELLVEADAMVEAKKLSLEQLENVCRVIFGTDTTRMSSAELKRDVLMFARSNPKDFLEVVNDPDLKFMGTIQRFFDQGILKTRKSDREVWYSTPNNKTKMLNVPFGGTPPDMVASYLQSDEGIEVLKHLEGLLD